MQSADDVQFRDADLQRLPRLPGDLLDGKLEAVVIALFASKRTELTRQDAIVRIVDVTVDDIAGVVADLALTHEISDGPDHVQVFRFKQAQCIGIGNAFARDDLVVDVAKFAALDEKIHKVGLTEIIRLANLSLHSLNSTMAAKLGVIRLVAAFPFDVAADAGRLKFGGDPAGQHRVERGAQIFSSHGNAIAGPAGVELAAINQAATAIKKVNVRRAGGAISFGNG